MTEDQK